MGIFRKTYKVPPNTEGYLYRSGAFVKKLTPGNYQLWNMKKDSDVFCLPTTSKLINVTVQEVLTRDNISFRFSFAMIYFITDGQKFLSRFLLDRSVGHIITDAEHRLYNITQSIVRNKISKYDAETLNERRHELANLHDVELLEKARTFGIEIEEVKLKELTYPKSVQHLFARHLESKIRAKSDLENAKAAVEIARTLKTASEIMENDDSIKFHQLMDTISKVADKEKRTLFIDDSDNNNNNRR